MNYRILPALTMLAVAAACSFNLAGMAEPSWVTITHYTDADKVTSVTSVVYSLFKNDAAHINVLRTCAFLLILATVLELITFFVMLPIFCAVNVKTAREMQRTRAIASAVLTLISALSSFAAFGLWMGYWDHGHQQDSVHFSKEYGIGLWLTLVAAILASVAFITSVLVAMAPKRE